MGGYSDGKTLVRYRSTSSVCWAKSKVITMGILGRRSIRFTQTGTSFGKHLSREVCKLVHIANFFKATIYFALSDMSRQCGAW